jgi:threonine dehydratase
MANMTKVTKAAQLGAQIVVHGTTSQQRRQKAQEICAASGAQFIHSHDDPDIIAGQGTVGLEIIEEWPDVEAILVPVGGGGLLAGISLIKEKHPAVQVIGVEPAGSAGTTLSLEKGTITPFPHVATAADGLRADRPGKLNFAVIQRHVDAMVTLTEAAIWQAAFELLEQEKILAEPSAAVPLAAIAAGKLPHGIRKVAVVLSGGNISLESLYGYYRSGS